MRCGRVRTLGQQGLELSSITIQFCGLSDLRAVQRDATLTEERMKEIIRSRREILVIQNTPFRLYQLAFYEKYDVQVQISVGVSGN